MNNYLIEKYRTIEITGNVIKKGYCVIDSRVHGLFACFYCILYGLYICEMEDLKPIVILDKKHLYFDEKKGDNVFEYFYRKQYRKDAAGLAVFPKITISDPGMFLQWCRVSTSEKLISNLLINRYFILKSAVLREIDQFTGTNFGAGRILGVHFRGTDKIKETLVTDFDIYENKIDLLLKQAVCDKFFFATDELSLKKYVKEKYKDKAIIYSLRGKYRDENLTEGLHFVHEDPYLSALDALVECYILARCSFLLSSSKSSMSLFATFINPDLFHLIIEP